jgi:hypothetical protein
MLRGTNKVGAFVEHKYVEVYHSEANQEFFRRQVDSVVWAYQLCRQYLSSIVFYQSRL